MVGGTVSGPTPGPAPGAERLLPRSRSGSGSLRGKVATEPVRPVRAEAGGAQPRQVIVVGASAGGVGALVALVRQLSADLPAAVLIVLHVSPTGLSVLPDILSRSTT